jgi:hypothetical protein
MYNGVRGRGGRVSNGDRCRDGFRGRGSGIDSFRGGRGGRDSYLRRRSSLFNN